MWNIVFLSEKRSRMRVYLVLFFFSRGDRIGPFDLELRERAHFKEMKSSSVFLKRPKILEVN